MSPPTLSLRRLIRAIRGATRLVGGSRRAAMAATFSEIHLRNAWGDPESASGPGSTVARAATFVDDLVCLLRSLNIRVLLDAPCGDFNWAGTLADAVERYIGVDVVPEIIARNQLLYTSPERTFLCRDLTSNRLPRADVILRRDCLVHFRLMISRWRSATCSAAARAIF